MKVILENLSRKFNTATIQTNSVAENIKKFAAEDLNLMLNEKYVFLPNSQNFTTYLGTVTCTVDDWKGWKKNTLTLDVLRRKDLKKF